MHESENAMGEKRGRVEEDRRAYTKPTVIAEAGWHATTGFDPTSGDT